MSELKLSRLERAVRKHLEVIEAAFADYPREVVLAHTGVVIDCLAELAAEKRIKGLFNNIEHELLPLATINRHLAAGAGNWRVVARS